MTIRAIYIYSQAYKAHAPNKTRTFPDGSAFINADVSEPLEILERSDCHLVSKIDPPMLVVPSHPVQVFPRSSLEIRSLPNPVDTVRLGKVVGQLLASGCVTNSQSRNLLEHLTSLAEAYDKLHRGLWCIPFDTLRLADEAVGERK